MRPNTKAPLAMTLKLNGYSTAQFGKCHEVPVWQTSPMGPFDAWPSGGGGFETFYGFIGGENNQYDPALYEGTTPVEPPTTAEEGYHLTEDLADRAVAWVRQQKALMPDKPFFMYFAPGATHAPHHVPKEWIEKYRGRFDEGWDVQRERTFARQKELGVVPAETVLTARHDEIPAWDDMPDELKPVLARQMEVYAAFLEHTDHHVGRVIDAIEDLGVLDDTLIYYIVGDNGASAEGTLERRVQRDGELQRHGRPGDAGVPAQPDRRARFAVLVQPLRGRLGLGDELAAAVDQADRVALGWHPQRDDRALARRHRREGRAALPVHARDRRGSDRARGGRAAGAGDGQRRAAVAHGGHEHAVHLRRSRTSPERHDLQYFEMFGNRGIYHKGWSAVTKHRTPWIMVGGAVPAFDDDVWELYDGSVDFSQAHDLAAEKPDLLAKLQRLWLIEATKYNVLPIDDRTAERFDPSTAGRPTLIRGTSQLFFAGMGRLSENSVVSIKNRSYSITAEIEVREESVHGVLIAQGGKFGGWSVWVDAGRLTYTYNLLGIQEFTVTADEPVPPGKHQVRMEFAYDGGGLAKGGDVTLFHDGTPVGSGRVGATQPMIFSADETTDIGYESGTTVSSGYTARTSRFTGKIHWVQLDVGTDDHDHFIDPEERLRIAMARQ